jgi:nuclear transcription factor Y, alpha
MESRPGGTNLVEPRAQAAALPPGGVAMQPWWMTGGRLGAVSPTVVAPGIGLSSNSLVDGVGKAGDDTRGESSQESRGSGESKGSSYFLLGYYY